MDLVLYLGKIVGWDKRSAFHPSRRGRVPPTPTGDHGDPRYLVGGMRLAYPTLRNDIFP